MSADVLIKWNKWFNAHNHYVDDCHVKWTKKFDHNVDEEEFGSGEDEKSEEYL